METMETDVIKIPEKTFKATISFVERQSEDMEDFLINLIGTCYFSEELAAKAAIMQYGKDRVKKELQGGDFDALFNFEEFEEEA